MRRPVGIAIALAGTLLVAACGGDDDPTTSATTGTAATDAERTTTTAEATTTTSVAPCPSLPAPVGAEGTSTAPGDVDGDGGEDQLVAYRTGGSWHVRVEVAAGGSVDLVLEVRPGDAIEIVGGADVDRDGGDEVWARVGTGASATIVGLLRFHGCALERVHFEGGDPAELPVGGSVGSPAGLSCAGDDDLTAYAALLGDDDTYDVTVTPYTLTDGVLVAGEPRTETVAADGEDVYRYATFSCGDLSL